MDGNGYCEKEAKNDDDDVHGTLIRILILHKNKYKMCRIAVLMHEHDICLETPRLNKH